MALTVSPPATAAPNDFNLDNKSDLVLSNANGLVDLWLMNGTTVSSRTTLLNSPGWAVSHLADFNGDGKTDILWRNVNGAVNLWLMDGTTVLSAVGLLGSTPDWTVSHVGDFNGDGKADILWRNTNGAVNVWLMNGGVVTTATALLGPTPDWQVSHLGDFNGDGRADILWRNTNGAVNLWLMNGGVVTAATALLGPTPDWQVSHLGDFNGDGRADIIWRNSNGAVNIWLMSGGAVSSAAGVLGPNADWRVSHLADFNGDDRADILWRNTNGAVTMWLMNGSAVSGAVALLGASTGWQVAQAMDLNGDKKADLTWRNTDGSINIWLMNGAVASAAAGLVGAGTWDVAPIVSLAPVDGPTVAAIDLNNRQAVLTAYQSIYVATQATPYVNAGLNVAACAAGDTTLAYKTAVIRTVNYYRAMSGLPGNVTLDVGLSAKAQQAALMMSANSSLSHAPPTTWACYSAAGADAAGHSNLALGASGPRTIGLYMADGGIPSLGHRRWVLYPPQTAIGTGDTSNANSLWVLGASGARPATPNSVAWPAAGFVPYQLIPSSIAWSFSMDGANFASTSVTVTKVGTGNVPVTRAVLDVGYGDNTISFMPTTGVWPYATTGDTSFDVQINGVILNGATRNFSYRVTLIQAP